MEKALSDRKPDIRAAPRTLVILAVSQIILSEVSMIILARIDGLLSGINKCHQMGGTTFRHVDSIIICSIEIVH